MQLEIARRKHSSHYVLEYMLLNGLEAMFFAQWVDERDIGGMRPDLGEQLEINAIDRFGILPEEIVNRRAIGGGADASLAPGARGKEKSDSSSEDSGAHESPSFYSYRSRDA